MVLRPLVPFRERTSLARPDFGLFGTLQREIDSLFEDFARSTLGTSWGQQTGSGIGTLVPSIDVTETDKEIEITAELPGLEHMDVEISIEDDMLIIRGEKRVERAEGDQNKNKRLTERSYGVFYRAIQLPPGVDPSSVQATMANGVLKITVPKPARSEAKKIEIREAA